MKVNQISGVLNDTIMKEITGQLPEGAETPIVKEDLSNIVDVGKTVLDELAMGGTGTTGHTGVV